MSYTTHDFSESIKGAKIPRESIKHVHAAWGYSPDGYSSWTGGFLVETKSGGFYYVTGWCDTTGWGCQDGTDVTYFESKPELATLDRVNSSYMPLALIEGASIEWEESPADLNRYTETGKGGWP